MISDEPTVNTERNSENPPPCHEKTGSESQPSETANKTAQSAVVQLPRKVAEDLKSFGLDPNDPDNISMIVKASFSSGLLPPAHELKAYSEASPEAVSKILEWADAFQRHRREMEEHDFKQDTNHRRTSQRNALVIALFGLSLSALLGWMGQMMLGIAVAVVAVGGPSTSSIVAQVLNRAKLDKD